MSTAKHYIFCSGPMDGKSVYDLPGIGESYGNRLRSHGYGSAKNVYDKFKSFNLDRDRCENWLSTICGANSRYAAMCFDAINEWDAQFGERYSSPGRYNQSKSELQFTPLSRYQDNIIPSRSGYLDDSPISRVHTPYKQSPEKLIQTPSSSKESDISRAEVLKMMADFQKKQDAMAARISDLEQEKSKTNGYVKTLEAKIKQMENVTTALQKQQTTRVEQYKTISSSIYLLSQKLDDLLTQQNELKQNSNINNHINILEARIKRLEQNTTEVQKQQNNKVSKLTKKINNFTAHIESYEKEQSLIDILAKKLDVIIKKQNKIQQDKSLTQEWYENRMDQIEQDIRNLTINLCEVTKKSSKKGLNDVENSQNALSAEQVKVTKPPSVVLEDEIVEQVKLFNKEHAISKTSSTTNNKILSDERLAASSGGC